MLHYLPTLLFNSFYMTCKRKINITQPLFSRATMAVLPIFVFDDQKEILPSNQNERRVLVVEVGALLPTFAC